MTLEAKKFAFGPTQLTISANSTVAIEVANTSDLPHTFMIEDLGVTVEVPPGETGSLTVNAPPGTYTYVCIYHPYRMAGTLIAA